jgi:hypothetical protein
MLTCLASTVTSCSDTFDSLSIGLCFCALRHLSAGEKEEEVKRVAVAMTAKVQGSTAELNGQYVGNALYGLQRMFSDSPELQALLSALTAKIQGSTAVLDRQTICNALYGLQRMSSDSPEVRALLSALTAKIRDNTVELDRQAAGNALYGL